MGRLRPGRCQGWRSGIVGSIPVRKISIGCSPRIGQYALDFAMSVNSQPQRMFEPLIGREKELSETAPSADLQVIKTLPQKHLGRYEYRDADRILRFVVQRYLIKRRKTFGQYTPFLTEDGEISWLKSLTMDRDRPLYRLPELLECDAACRIMVVEGEKCVEAVQKHYDKMFPVTWVGGANAWQRTDFSPLHGRPLTLVADGDEGGHKAMKSIAAQLHPHCHDILLVLPTIAPDGPDIADVIEAKKDVEEWLEIHGQTYIPDCCSEELAEHVKNESNDEWASLIEQTKSKPGLMFEPEVIASLVALKRDRMQDWVNMRARIKRNCPDVLIGELEQAMKSSNGSPESVVQGRAIKWLEHDPWPLPVEGGALLSELSSLLRRYVDMPRIQADAIALWIIHAWLHDRLELSTFLNVTSPTKRCGKSLLMEIVSELVPRPLVAAHVTTAVVFRTVEIHQPTLLLDEADTYFVNNPDLQAVINGSQRRSGATVWRVVGENHEPRQFGTWCPKMIVGIGSLPDTVQDRSLVIRLQRRPPHADDLPLWRNRDREAIENMLRKAIRWRNDNVESVLNRRNEVSYPPGLNDRARDAWETPLAIADCAGAQWAGPGGRAWRAAKTISAGNDDETSASEQLLKDIWKIFHDADNPKVIRTAEILARLHSLESRPWSEWHRGKPLSPRSLAVLLKPFRIASGTVRLGSPATASSTAKGYYHASFIKAWKRYSCEDAVNSSVTPSQSASSNGLDTFSSVTYSDLVTDAMMRKPWNGNGCDVVTDRLFASWSNDPVVVIGEDPLSMKEWAYWS